MDAQLCPCCSKLVCQPCIKVSFARWYISMPTTSIIIQRKWIPCSIALILLHSNRTHWIHSHQTLCYIQVFLSVVLRSHKKNVHPLSGNIYDGQQSCSACCVVSADIAHLSCGGFFFLHWAEMAYGSEIRMSTLSCTLACLTACKLPIHLGNLTGKSKLLIFFLFSTSYWNAKLNHKATFLQKQINISTVSVASLFQFFFDMR